MRQRASKEDLANLLEMAKDDLATAGKIDWSVRGRYQHAYGAALSLAAVVVRGAGYRPHGEGHHHTLFEALELVAPALGARAKFFDKARGKRNTMSYDKPQAVTPTETDELLAAARGFETEVLAWVKANRADALPPPAPPAPPPPATSPAPPPAPPASSPPTP